MHRRLLLIFGAFSCMCLGVFAQTPDYSGLTAKNHPRLFITDSELKDIRKHVSSGSNHYLELFHQQMMKTADTYGLSSDSLKYDSSTSTHTLLPTMRNASVRIVSASYAFRYTKDKAYLKHAVMDINTVCDNMKRWASSYDLERAEIALAMAIAYDWLYKSLPAETKRKMLKFVQTEVFDAMADSKFYKATNNWNQVCNCGISVAALSTYENWPQRAQFLIEKSVASNPIGMKAVYAPDGASPEGPGYWSYATSYEGIFLMALSDCLGTDFGLSLSEGFARTCRYYTFCINGMGLYFNYSDCGSRAKSDAAMWYCAWRFNDPSMLTWQIKMLEKEKYVGSRTLFLALVSAFRMGDIKAKSPKERTFVARGEVPVAIIRNGWKAKDAYAGLKGGTPKASHAHMDEGSFVYDCDGVRWVAEYPHEEYENYRRALKEAGSQTSLFSFKQDSWRWHVFAYSPRQHSVITVDDSWFDVDGFAEITDVKEEKEYLSASVDVSSMYFGRLSRSFRTLQLMADGSLKVIDELTAGEKDIHLRWSFVSTAKASVADGGIVLRKSEKSMSVSSSLPSAEYRVWPNNPAAYDSPIGRYEKAQKGYNIAGYEFDMKAGETITVVTTFKRM